MKHSLNFIWLPVVMLFFSACTSSRWITQEEPAIDLSQSEKIAERPTFVVTGMPTPERPVLTLEARQVETFRYPMKLEAHRVIQRYRPRYGWAAFGVLGAGGLVYIANSDGFFENDLSSTQRTVIMGSAGLVLVGSLLNMRPVGEPSYTGEKRFLNQVGTEERSDTTGSQSEPFDVIISAKHGDEDVINGLQMQLDGTLNINLIRDLGLRSFSPDNSGEIDITIKSEFEEKQVSVPVDQVLKRYVRIAARNTPLRSSPQITQANVITTVAEASLLPWVETTGDGWYRVLLGITPTYVRNTDGALIWRPATSNESNLVITTSDMSFGSIDVERDIPRNQVRNEQAIAVLIGNQGYRSLSHRNEHAHRSVRLMRAYLRETLGYSNDRIVIIEDFRNEETVDNLLKYDASVRTLHDLQLHSGTDLFVYYSGAGGVVEARDGLQAGLLPVDGLTGEGIALNEIMRRLADLPVRSVQVMIDADFRELQNGGLTSEFRADYNRIGRILTDNKTNSWVLFASEPNQIAGRYVSMDRRTDRAHGILTYYFARALQDGNTETDMILRYILRNITFTSRRLHNRAQDPVFLGNRQIELLRETTE